MSNVVEFILKLKDMMSNGMQHAAATTRRTMDSAERAVQKVAHANKVAGVGVATAARTTSRHATRSIATLERALRMVERRRDISIDTREVKHANRAVESLQGKIDRLRGGRRGGYGGGILGFLGSTRGLAAGLGLMTLIAGGGKVMGMGMNTGATRTSFETMAGQQGGGKLFGDLTKFAQDSIFGNEVYKDAQTMLAFGGAAKSVMPDLKMLGDISMGDKDKLGSLTLAFSQIRATGRLMGQDLLQLVNAGFNPLQVISQKTGISMADLKKKMEAGAISFDMVKKAFQDATGPGGKFYQMTQKIAETPFGKWEALKGQISGIGMQLGTTLLPIASRVIDTISPFVDQLPAMIDKMAPSIDKLSKDLMPLITSIGGIFMDVLPPALRLVGNLAHILLTALNPVLKVVGYIAESIGHLMDGIADVISFGSDKVKSATGGMMDGIANTISNSKSGVVGAMSDVIAGSDMDSLFQAAGKRHGQLYAQELQETVASIQLTMPQKEALASFAAPLNAKTGKAQTYLDYLSTPKTAKEILDMAPAILRQTGLNQGRDAFEKLVKSYENAGKSGLFSKKDAAVISAGIKKIADEQRNYLIKLATGTGGTATTGYEGLSGAVSKKKGKGLSSSGVTSGGPRTITINVNKEMIGKLAINSYNVKEGVSEMENLVEEALRRVLYSAEAS